MEVGVGKFLLSDFRIMAGCPSRSHPASRCSTSAAAVAEQMSKVSGDENTNMLLQNNFDS